MPEAYKVKIEEVIRETPDVKTFRLAPVPDTFDFLPGQFVMVGTEIPGDRRIQRAYSIANPPTRRGYVDITIRKMEEGRLSRFLCDQGEAGMELSMMGPYGKFVFTEGMADRLVLIGAGSGVVPLMCMVRYAQDRNLPIDLRLLYSSKDWDFVIYREELSTLHECMQNLNVMHTLTRVNGHDWHGFRGRINRDMVRCCVPEEDIPGCLFYICGPPRMVDLSVELLEECGADRGQIRMEKYD